MFSSQRLALLHLSLIEGIGPRSIEKIIRSLLLLGESIEDLSVDRGAALLAPLYSFSQQDFMARCGLSADSARKIVSGLASKRDLENECTLALTNNCSLVTIFDEDYPPLLKHIHAPPPVLYYKGTLRNDRKRIACIGSRDATAYGREVASYFAGELAALGWSVVSGGARGIDSVSHAAAIEQGGVSEVVLGSGLLRPYPEENRGLFDRVVESGGALISSFSLKSSPLKGNFPARNRIIAGMSQGCLVVQAQQKSGALISAQCALEEGRAVFAVPGLMYDEYAVGCHNLIKQGAKLTSSISDIVEEFGEALSDGTQLSFIPTQGTHSAKSSVQKRKEENPLLALLEKPRSLDELSSLLSKPFSQLHAELFDLQIEGKVKQNFAGLWEKYS